MLMDELEAAEHGYKLVPLGGNKKAAEPANKKRAKAKAKAEEVEAEAEDDASGIRND